MRKPTLRPTDTIRGYVTIPKGKRVTGETPIGRKRVTLPTGVSLPFQGTRDGLCLTVGLDSIGPVFVNPMTIRKSWIEVTMRGGAYDRFNGENKRSYVPMKFYHDGGTTPIPENVDAYLANFKK